MLKPISAAAAMLIAAAVVAPTVSQAETPRSMRVSYADLNLGAAQGQQALHYRVAGAARTVCDLGETSRELKLAQITALCRNETIANAQPAMDAAINAARRGTVTVLDGAALIITAQ